jgi:hypothetical protein
VWQIRALRRNGRRANGVVRSCIDRGSVRIQNRRTIHKYDLVMEVTIDQEPPYRVSLTLDAGSGAGSYLYKEGNELPLLVDPRDRERVLIDFDTIDERREAVQRQELEAAERKRRALLDEQPPQR